ncbi:hypothetical protein [Xanthobacter autotrophicus]|uniref:hypothetical protein n=1 Tax=Xanthobacter autotrophicus TaxID=280 RepID=UPI00372BB0FA
MTETVFHEGGGFRVTSRLLVTPRKTFALERVEYVALTRPLLLVSVPPALALVGTALRFARYLAPVEIGLLIGVPLLAVAFASVFATLRVHSLALRSDEVGTVFGPVHRLRRVRLAVEAAMLSRSR